MMKFFIMLVRNEDNPVRCRCNILRIFAFLRFLWERAEPIYSNWVIFYLFRLRHVKSINGFHELFFDFIFKLFFIRVDFLSYILIMTFQNFINLNLALFLYRCHLILILISLYFWFAQNCINFLSYFSHDGLSRVLDVGADLIFVFFC